MQCYGLRLPVFRFPPSSPFLKIYKTKVTLYNAKKFIIGIHITRRMQGYLYFVLENQYIDIILVQA